MKYWGRVHRFLERMDDAGVRLLGWLSRVTGWSRLGAWAGRISGKPRAKLRTELFVAAALAVTFFFLLVPATQPKAWGDDKGRQLCTYLVDGKPSSSEALVPAHRPRIGAPLLAGWYCKLWLRHPPENDLYKSGYIAMSHWAYDALAVVIASFHVLWLGLCFLVLIVLRKDALLLMLGTFAGLVYNFIEPAAQLCYPWDLSIMCLFTLALLLFDRGRIGWMLVVVAAGSVVKETIFCCALMVFFAQGWNWRKRIGAFAGTLVAGVLARKVLMAIYGINSVVLPLNDASTYGDMLRNIVLFKNMDLLFSLNLNHVVFANAGALVCLVLVPWRNRREVAFKVVAVSFIVGQLFCGVIDEFRIWYELLPLGWIMISEAWQRYERGTVETAEVDLSQKALRGGHWLLVGSLGVFALGSFTVGHLGLIPRRELGRGLVDEHLNLLLNARLGNTEAQFRLAAQYLNESDPAKAAEGIQWLQRAALAGDASAERAFGTMCMQGRGVPKDPQEATKWWRKAAEHGDAMAQYSLGFAYAKGTGVPQDNQEALKWFRKAGEGGDLDAQRNLAAIYYSGGGFAEPNLQEAAFWCRKAAEQGDAVSQVNLGMAYANGQGVAQSFPTAYAWMQLAVAQGEKQGAANLESLLKLMTPEQIEEGKKLAETLRPKGK